MCSKRVATVIINKQIRETAIISQGRYLLGFNDLFAY